jgi:hypothetical protein
MESVWVFLLGDFWFVLPGIGLLLLLETSIIKLFS